MTANPPWPQTTVGREFQVTLGKMLDADRNTGVPKPFVGNRAVQWGRIDVSAAGTVPLTLEDQRRYRLRAGDLLVCEGGEVGRAAIWQDQMPECYYQKAIHRLRPEAGYRPDVLLALLEVWASRGGFADFVTQTSIAHLPRERFLKMPLPLIPRAEQDAIAEVLCDVHLLVTALERLVVKKEAMKQGLMQELLTRRTRLPGFDGEWVERDLGASAVILDNLRIPLSALQRSGRKGQYPYCGANGVVDYIDDYMIDDDVILLAEDGGNFNDWRHRPIAYRMRGKIWVNNHAHVLKARTDQDTGFLFFALEHKDITPFISSGTRSKLTRAELVRTRLEFPATVAEQHAIAQVFTDADDELAALRARWEKAKAVRHGMMQELVTGRTRLPVHESADASAAEDSEAEAA